MAQRHPIIGFSIAAVSALFFFGGCKSKEEELRVRRFALAPSSNAAAPSASAAMAIPRPAASVQRRVTDVTTLCVEAAQASSEQSDHPAGHAFDGKRSTAWNNDAPNGKNEWVEARLKTGTYVERVEVGAGWSAVASGTDLWVVNSSFRLMRVTWEGGSADVRFLRATAKGVRKTVPIGAKTSFVRFTAIEVDRGGSKDLCLDEATVFGWCPLDCEDAVSDCDSDLFVELATVPEAKWGTDKYEDLWRMMEARPELVDTRLVEVRRDDQLLVGALVKNRCVGQKLGTRWVTGPTRCEKVTVSREVWSVPEGGLAVLPVIAPAVTAPAVTAPEECSFGSGGCFPSPSGCHCDDQCCSGQCKEGRCL